MKVWLKVGFVFSIIAVTFLVVFYYYGSKQCEKLNINQPIAGQPGLMCLYRFPPTFGEIVLFLVGGFVFGSLLGFLSSLILSKFQKNSN